MIRKRLGLEHEDLTYEIIGAFREVYYALGSQFLESVYLSALVRELRMRRLRGDREVAVRVYYKGAQIAWQRLDLVVEDKVLVELKTGVQLPITAVRQIENYLHATTLEVGLLLHFGHEPKAYRFYAPNTRKPQLESRTPDAGDRDTA